MIARYRFAAEESEREKRKKKKREMEGRAEPQAIV